MSHFAMHCNGNSVYIFLFWELRDLSPNFHIHVSVSDLYVPRIGPHISSSRKGRPIVGIYNSLTDMNLEIGTEALIFLFWEYLFQIFGILSLQCEKKILLTTFSNFRVILYLRTLHMVTSKNWTEDTELYTPPSLLADTGTVLLVLLPVLLPVLFPVIHFFSAVKQV
jgi:hypothetical protein